MLIAFYGTDTIRVREKAYDFVHAREEKGIRAVQITSENFSTGVLEDAAGGTSLFGEQQLFVIDTPSEDAEMLALVFDNLEMLSESPNTFVLIERGLLASQKKKLEKYAEECTELAADKKNTFNIFSLTEALLRRDKKSLWMLLLKARGAGASDEEIIGTLFWQIKTLRLAERSGSAEETGLKSFSYTKAKRALLKFKEGEIDKLSRDLVTLYHDGHQGKRDLDIALERWVLSV